MFQARHSHSGHSAVTVARTWPVTLLFRWRSVILITASPVDNVVIVSIRSLMLAIATCGFEDDTMNSPLSGDRSRK